MTASDHLKHRTGSLGGEQIPEDLKYLTEQIHSQPYSTVLALIERIAKAEAALAQKTRECEQASWEKCCTDIKQRLKSEVEQLQVQLAGCLTAAEGWGLDQPAKQGDYGWSLAYQKTLELRAQVEQLGRQVAEMSKPVTDEEWAKYHGWIVNMLEDDDDREPFQYACMNRQELDKFIASRARTK